MKYIDAEKLKKYIENKRNIVCDGLDWDDMDESQRYAAEHIDDILDFIESLQQEQPEAQNGKFVFPKYLYARTKDNKTIDMSYAPQDLTAVEYIRNDFVEQEQSEVDLEKEIDDYLYSIERWEVEDEPYRNLDKCARHFYELGRQNRSKISNNSLKELRKEVIKFNQEHFDELHSDMDTIDIVHIVAVHFFELGLNARKE